jgi:hypothetical protein
MTYLDVEMGYFPLVEIGEALYELTHELDHVCFKWHQIVVYNGLQIASRSTANITKISERSLIIVNVSET